MSRYTRAMADISIPAPAQPLPAYFAAPSGNRRWPGVVVIHDIFGMDEDPRRHVDWFAKAGYLAVAPNLFFWGKRLRCLVSTMRDYLAGHGQALDAIEAAGRCLDTNPT